MFRNNHSYEEQTQRLLAETVSELKELEAKREEIEQKITVLTKEAQALEGALQAYWRRIGKTEVAEPNWPKILKKGTHKQRLIRIAERNDGRIKASQATDILYRLRFIKSKRRANAYSIVQALLTDLAEENVLEKVAPGEYRLR